MLGKSCNHQTECHGAHPLWYSRFAPIKAPIMETQDGEKEERGPKYKIKKQGSQLILVVCAFSLPAQDTVVLYPSQSKVHHL